MRTKRKTNEAPRTTKTHTSAPARRRTSQKSKSIRKCLELARDHIYWASGIVVCCTYAAGGRRLHPEPDRKDIAHALEGAHALLERAGSAVIDVLDDELDEGSGEGKERGTGA